MTREALTERLKGRGCRLLCLSGLTLCRTLCDRLLLLRGSRLHLLRKTLLEQSRAIAKRCGTWLV